MKYINTDFDIPYYNFALENYLITDPKFTDDYFFFYIHKPSVIIGKHQNAYEEVNTEFIKNNNIYVARRLSGGGCVYHDEGNLNFSFITNKEKNQTIDFKRYTKYIISALKDYGIDALLQGRNDLCVNERKFGGNAQYIQGNKVLHHGTIMVDVNIENMLNALNVSNMKIESKAIKSVRSRVINLSECAGYKIDINTLKENILKEIFKEKDVDTYALNEYDIAKITHNAETEFAPKEYNWGTNYPFGIIKKKKYPCGIIQANINVKNNLITDFTLSGDFFTNKDLAKIKDSLLNTPFEQESVTNELKKIDFDGYINNCTIEEMIDLLFY